MSNSYKKKRKSIFSFIENFLQKSAISEGLPIKYLRYIIFIFILGIFYVANSHYHQKLIRKIYKIEKEIIDLRFSYTTLKASCMFSLKQSEIVKKAKELGLVESIVPPYLIKK